MARDTSPQCKQCRREGTKLFLKGERCLTDKCAVERRNTRRATTAATFAPIGVPGQRRRKGARSTECSKSGSHSTPSKPQEGVTVETCCCCSIPASTTFSSPRFAASGARPGRYSHGHWYINGRRVDIPSYQVREDDVITLKPSAPVEPVIREATELTSAVPAWLQADHDGLTAKVLRLPDRAEITTPVQEQLIVELYSK